MRAFTTGPAAACRRPGTGLHYLVISGLLWGTGGLTGSLLSRTAGLSAISVAACRLTTGGVLIVIFLTVTGRRWPASRAAWTRITVIGLLAALYQSCYFTAVSLTSVPLATLVTIGLAAIGLLIALGTGPTAVAYTLYFRGLRSAAASTAALLALLEPLTGTILAAVLLGERLSATGIAGAATIATAVILTVRANRAKPRAPRHHEPGGCPKSLRPVTAPEQEDCAGRVSPAWLGRLLR